MRARFFPALLATALLAGCNSSSDHLTLINGGNTSIEDGAIRVEGSQIVLHPEHGASATIGSSGDFAVDGRPVEITPAQRALLLQYYAGAAAVREHGVATGKAGAAIAGEALKGVASSIAGGEGKSPEDRVNAQADKVKQAALKICDDLEQIRDAQDQLATQLDAFKPYGQLITADSVSECRKGNSD
ncbi:hypothetical protein ISP17_16500 [Dyella ginsengisoli]|uniref:DUF2884 family protein n=1 Tax=Dyella ginsengisoli TaxID=363848 RepID=A0ABW8JWR2_9GAMM